MSFKSDEQRKAAYARQNVGPTGRRKTSLSSAARRSRFQADYDDWGSAMHVRHRMKGLLHMTESWHNLTREKSNRDGTADAIGRLHKRLQAAAKNLDALTARLEKAAKSRRP